jgi:hypothetical protein
MFKWIRDKWRKLVREIKYRRRIRQLKKKDPFTYK